MKRSQWNNALIIFLLFFSGRGRPPVKNRRPHDQTPIPHKKKTGYQGRCSEEIDWQCPLVIMNLHGGVGGHSLVPNKNKKNLNADIGTFCCFSIPYKPNHFYLIEENWLRIGFRNEPRPPKNHLITYRLAKWQLAIWEPSFWNFLVTFGHNGHWDIS